MNGFGISAILTLSIVLFIRAAFNKVVKGKKILRQELKNKISEVSSFADRVALLNKDIDFLQKELEIQGEQIKQLRDNTELYEHDLVAYSDQVIAHELTIKNLRKCLRKVK